MKTLNMSAMLLLALFFSTSSFAEYDPTNDVEVVMPQGRFKLIASEIEHSNPNSGGTSSGCCDVNVRLKVTYTENGQTYTAWSTTKTVSPGGSQVLSVLIGNNAVVTDEAFEMVVPGTSFLHLWTYTTDTYDSAGDDGVGLCSSCATISELILYAAPNGSSAKKYFWFDWIP